jgi:uncharacterized tellurite resistance protein B-like protein
MNLAQSGYQMLMILSVVDGQYSVSEGKIIVDYLTKNYDLDIDIDHENQVLLEVPKKEIPDQFKKAASEFLENSTEEQRLDFIAFAYRLINADGTVGNEENRILNSLAHFWHIDIRPLMEEL